MPKKKADRQSNPRRLAPEHLRPEMPEVGQYERALAELLAAAKAKGLPIESAGMPDTLRALLPDCVDLDDLRRALMLLRHVKSPVTPEDMFRAFASLRVLSEPEQLADLMAYLVAEGVEHAKSNDSTEMAAARCFAAFAGQAWQCGSIFPSHAEDYAAWVRQWLEARSPRKGKPWTKSAPPALVRSDFRPPATPPTDEDIRLLEKLLLSGGVEENEGDLSRCGFMGWWAEDADSVTRSEYDLRYGLNTGLITAAGWKKYEEFEKNLGRSAFAAEWSALKRRFPEQTKDAGKRIFHRTLMRERKWQREDIARFDTDEQKFRAFFDLLCWKYCLWGVENDRPLLMKPTVNLTPYGTQVFLPAFMSIDHKRDLNLKHLTDLHRARGIRRQGETLALNREDSRQRALDAAEGAQDAAEDNLHGEARIEHISQFIRKNQVFDPGAISRMTKRGRKIRAAEARRSPRRISAEV